MARKVIHIPGNWHGGQPIPAASKTGPLVTSGGVSGLDPETNKVAEDLTKQVEWAFEHVRRIMTEAGGSPEDIAHMNVYVKSRDVRPLLNEQWVKMFPNEESRPTRHTIQYDALAGGMELQIQFIAYVGS
ncbi:MAG: RidA family protein [Dehalococcoidia bacterium]